MPGVRYTTGAPIRLPPLRIWPKESSADEVADLLHDLELDSQPCERVASGRREANGLHEPDLLPGEPHLRPLDHPSRGVGQQVETIRIAMEPAEAREHQHADGERGERRRR